MKPFLVLTLSSVLLLTSCTTLQNRRYLWEEQKVEGPYTRMLAEKPWPWPRKAPPATDTGMESAEKENPWGK